MGVSDARRLEVYEQARAQWGEGPAEALMEMVVPAGQDMATRQDVESAATLLRTDLEASIARLRADMEASIARLRADMDVRFARLEERVSGLASKEYVLRALIVGLLPVYGMLIALLFGMYGS
jgi:hypothetical protein